MTETKTTEKQTFRIDLNFSAELAACPSCEHEQNFSGDYGKAECLECGYHAGSDLDALVSDHISALKLSEGFELEDSYIDSSETWIEVSTDVDTFDTERGAAIWSFVEEEKATIDWDHTDGPLFVNSMVWLRLPHKLNCGLPDIWQQRDETELRAMLDGHVVVKRDNDFLLAIYDDTGDFRYREGFATEEDAEADFDEDDYEDTDAKPVAIADTDDEKVCEWAIEQAVAGESVWSAYDEDGYYFAVEVN